MAPNLLQDHYTILALPFPSPTTLSRQDLKLAYHRALLRHHPDKSASTTTQSPPSAAATPPINQNDQEQGTYTIDQITTAYKTLADPAARAEYDRALRLDRAKVVEREKNAAVLFHTGLEVVDLEDLAFVDGGGSDAQSQSQSQTRNAPETENYWYRGCRCGDERGFSLTEEDLEREAERGESEIVVGCRGCSLWMKVLFAVEDEHDHDHDEGENHDQGGEAS